MTEPDVPRSGGAPSGDTAQRPAAVVRTVTGATLAMTLSVLPFYLVAGLAVLLRADLGFSELQLGLTVAAYPLSSALFSIPGGRLGDRLGAYRSMVVSLGLSALALVAIGLLARSWVHLAVFLGIAGIAQAVAAPGTNLALARGLPTCYQGVAFGVKTSSVPIAGMVAGLALPLVGLTLGWRWAFVGAVVAAAATFAILPRDLPSPTPLRTGPGRRTGIHGDLRPLLRLAVAAAFAAAADASMMAFFVVAAVASGVSEAHAGTWLFVGSICAVAARTAWGRRMDRGARTPLSAAAWLLLAGSAGLALLGLATSPMVLVAATLLVFGAGHAWTGLFYLAVVRDNPVTPAAATGVASLGLRVGSMAGPIAFGAAVELASYRVAWLGAAMLMAAGSCTLLVGRRAP